MSTPRGTAVACGSPSMTATPLNSLRPSSEAQQAQLLRGSAPSTFASAPGSFDQAYQAAQELVSIALIQPMLEQAHKSPFKVDRFHGGQGETMFQQKLDSIIAQRMVQASNAPGTQTSPRLPVVDAVYRSLQAHTQGTQGTKGVSLRG